MNFVTKFIFISSFICAIYAINVSKIVDRFFRRDSVSKSNESSDAATKNETLIDTDDDTITDDADNGGKDCPSYQKVAEVVPWGNRGEKCCLDKSSPPSRKNICYTNKKGTPWQNIPQLPLCPAEIGPEFYIFTPEDVEMKKKEGKDISNNNLTSQNIDYTNLNNSVKMVNLTKSRQFFIIVHGFHTKYWDKNWMFIMKDVLIELGHKVMVVKWAKGSNVKDYSKAAANTGSVATSIANVVDALISTGKVTLDHLTLIGFSLGAHVSGYVGSLFNGQIPRILALDPAGPLFVCQDPATRLDPTDAKFVQVIHTNGISFLDGGLGTPVRLGHVDFYPNGGLTQPGCPTNLVKKIATKVVTFNFSSVKDVSCSHGRAPLLATELLKEALKQSTKDAICKFQTFPCTSFKDWKWGRCFKACLHPGTNSDECPIPGLDLLFSTPKTYKQRFYFNTLHQSDNAGPGNFCVQRSIPKYNGFQHHDSSPYFTDNESTEQNDDSSSSSAAASKGISDPSNKKSSILFEDPNGKPIFRPKKILILTKLTRLEFERRTNPSASDEELSKILKKRGSDYNRLLTKYKVHTSYVNAICSELKKQDIEYRIVQRWDYNEANIDWADAVFTAGGDGTFLLAASKIRNRYKPVIGLNTDPSGSEGYMCLLKKLPQSKFPEALNRLLSGDFQ